MDFSLPSQVSVHRRPSDAAIRGAAVTFLMPAYNTSPFIAEAIDSVLKQTRGDLLLHVHDDGSTDRTLAAALEAADERCLVTAGPNLGSGEVRNMMIRAATTRFVTYMDSDDVSLPTRAASQLGYLAAHPDIDMVAGSLVTFGPHAPAEQREQPRLDPDDVAAWLLQGTPFALGGATARTEALIRVPYRDLNVAEDLDLLSRLVREGSRLAATGEPVLRYRIHGANTSLRDTSRRRVTASVKRGYHEAMLGGPGRQRFTEWMIWASEEHSPGLQDCELMDSSLWMALGPGLQGVSSTALDMRKVAAVAREMAVRQFVRRAGLASAALLPLAGRALGPRPALVGLKRGLVAGRRWSLRSQADPALSWRGLNDSAS